MSVWLCILFCLFVFIVHLWVSTYLYLCDVCYYVVMNYYENNLCDFEYVAKYYLWQNEREDVC